MAPPPGQPCRIPLIAFQSACAMTSKPLERSPTAWPAPRSLRVRLALLWFAVAAACGVAAYLMLEMFQISVSAQIDKADAILSRSCGDIAERYRFYSSGWQGTQDLQSTRLNTICRPMLPSPLGTGWGSRVASGRAEPGRWPMLFQPTRAPAQRQTFRPRNSAGSRP